MKIGVLGAGALGCAIGGVLTEVGEEVWLINRSEAQVASMSAHGLHVRDGDRLRAVPVNATTRCEAAGVMDLIIVLVKSFDTRAAIEQAAPMIGTHTLVLSLQNGLGHEEILAEVVGKSRVLAGKTYVGGVMTGLGKVTIGTRGKLTIIGELDGTVSERVRRVAETFNRAGLETRISDNILGTIWDKLLINVATGALSGITSLVYGQLYAIAELETTALAAVAEAMAVARAQGVALSIKSPGEAWELARAGLPFEFKTSMLQSLEKGARTEIDFINGAVVRWGERVKVSTPVNATLVACIKGIERRRSVNPA